MRRLLIVWLGLCFGCGVPDPGELTHDPSWGLIEGAKPLAELPAHVDAPEGQVSLVAGPMQGDHRMVYLVNRIRRPIRAEWDRPVRQVRLRDGSFEAPPQPVAFEPESLIWICGNGLMPAYTNLLPAGAFIGWQIALPEHRQAATVRFVGMYGLTTGPISGVFDPQRAVVARVQQQIQTLSSPDVALLALGIGLPELAPAGRRDIRWAALLELQRPRHAAWPERVDVLAELALPATPSVEPEASRLSAAALQGLLQIDPKRGRDVLTQGAQ